MRALLAAILLTFVAGGITMSSAYAEFDIQTNGTHYLITGYQNNNLYGNELSFEDGSPISTGTLRIDSTNGDRWYQLSAQGHFGDFVWKWFQDSTRTLFLDSISFSIVEPEPDPVPEDFTVCHKGKTKITNEKSFQAHLKHGDAMGTCPEIIPTNSTSRS